MWNKCRKARRRFTTSASSFTRGVFMTLSSSFVSPSTLAMAQSRASKLSASTRSMRSTTLDKGSVRAWSADERRHSDARSSRTCSSTASLSARITSSKSCGVMWPRRSNSSTRAVSAAFSASASSSSPFRRLFSADRASDAAAATVDSAVGSAWGGRPRLEDGAEEVVAESPRAKSRAAIMLRSSKGSASMTLTAASAAKKRAVLSLLGSFQRLRFVPSDARWSLRKL